jgi:putative ABC transport system permease protein
MGLRLEGISRDLHVASRALVRRPLLSITAAFTLMLGIGATTAIYTVVDGVLLAPLPYPGGDRIVRITATFEPWDMQGVDLTPLILQEWAARTSVFETVGAYAASEVNLVGGGTPAVVRAARVTPGFLSELLSQQALVGRLLTQDGGGSDTDAALLSERLWRKQFGGGLDVLGATLRVDERSLRVVGVLPEVVLLPDVDVWTFHPMERDDSRQILGTLVTLARLVPGAGIREAQRDLAAAAAAATVAGPELLEAWTPEVTDYRAGLVRDVRMHLLLLFGAGVAVLLIACANVANLLLARGVERSHEIALRRSLGATPGHLFSQALTESVLLAAVGGVGGAVVTSLAVDGLLALLPSEMPLGTTVSVDGRVLGFATLLTIGTGVVVGSMPTLRVLARAGGVTGSGRVSASRRERRTGRLLLGLQVAQASVLLVAAGLMLNTLSRMARADAGFDPDGLAVVHLNLPDYAYGSGADADRRIRFLEDLDRRVRALPAVREVGVGSATPFSGMTFMAGLEQEGGVRPDAGDGGFNVFDPDNRALIYFSRTLIGPSYLDALALPVRAGRPLADADWTASEAVGLVNETAAGAYWPGESPLGKRIRGGDDEPWITIVGVVADVAHPALASKGLAELYVPLTRDELPAERRPHLVVRHDGRSQEIVDALRRTVWQVDPELPIPLVATAREQLGAGLAVPRFYAALLGLLASLALALAAVGVYGTVAHSVAQRTKEIGIRLALGATDARVFRTVFRDGMDVIFSGLAVGLVGAVAVSDLLEGLLYEISPIDPWTYAGVAVTLASVAAAAIWLPARRVMRASPLDALRGE